MVHIFRTEETQLRNNLINRVKNFITFTEFCVYFVRRSEFFHKKQLNLLWFCPGVKFGCIAGCYKQSGELLKRMSCGKLSEFGYMHHSIKRVELMTQNSDISAFRLFWLFYKISLKSIEVSIAFSQSIIMALYFFWKDSAVEKRHCLQQSYHYSCSVLWFELNK